MLQNIINEPSQHVPLEKNGSGYVSVCKYSPSVHMCASVCLCACAGKRGLNGKRKVDGERIREGSEGVRWPFNLESLM